MNLYIDGWFLRPPRRGIGQYLNNLLINFPKDFDKYNVKLLIPNNFSIAKSYPANIEIIKIEEKIYLFGTTSKFQKY